MYKYNFKEVFLSIYPFYMHLNHHFFILLVLVDIGYLFAKTLNITVKCNI